MGAIIVFDDNPKFLKSRPEKPSCFSEYMTHYFRLHTERPAPTPINIPTPMGVATSYSYNYIPYSKIYEYVKNFMVEDNKIFQECVCELLHSLDCLFYTHHNSKSNLE